MKIIFNQVFASVSFSHFIVDAMNGQRTIFLTYMVVLFGMNNSALALYTTIAIVSAAMAQPIFGYVADRLGPRWVVAGGVIWMSIFFTAAMLIPGKLSLLFFILAHLGSGAFHSAGSMSATLVGRSLLAGREATAASLFFLFGQLGYFLGPVAGGRIIDGAGPSGLLVISIPALIIGIFAAVNLGKKDVLNLDLLRSVAVPPNKKVRLIPILGLVIVAACQAWSQQNIIVFLPKYLSDQGFTAGVYGIMAALFSAGSAIGGVIGAGLADRFGRRLMIFLSMLLAAFPLFFISTTSYSIWLYGLVILGGLLTGGAFSIIVVIAQRLVPVGMGLASGLVLGFIFSSGALGTMLTGMIADRSGIPLVFVVNAAIAAVGGIAALLIQE
ncbi:MAG TPA: MFS transporter [Anaerolineaceae bacterium]